MKKQLWEAVLESPDNIDARLVYADALTEEGDPRGEFISLQCRMAANRLRGAALKAAKAREFELLDAHREEWFGPLEKWLRERDSYALGHVKVERGFVTECKLWVREADDVGVLFKKAPLLESLKLFGAETSSLSALQGLRHLEAASDVSTSMLSFISSGARFDRLTHLELVGIEGEHEAKFGHLASLKTLVCDAVATSVSLPASLESLTWNDDETPLTKIAMPSLRKLALSRLQVDVDVTKLLQAQAPHLERLVLDWAKFEAGQLAVLLKTPWPKLKALDLSSATLGPDGPALLAAMKAPQLESLDVSNTRLKDDAVSTLLSSPLLEHVKELSLRANKVTGAALAPVLKRKHQLRLLNLKKTAVSPADQKRLAKELPDTRLSR